MAALSQTALFAATDEDIVDRGRGYVSVVSRLRIGEGTATANVRGTHSYRCELQWDTRSVTGWCSCPHSQSGYFCKHLVAVGLAIVGDTAEEASEQAAHPVGSSHSIEAVANEQAQQFELVNSWLSGLSHSELIRIVLEMSSLSETGQRMLITRAVMASGNTQAVAKELHSSAKQALSFRGFIDYYRAYEVAQSAEELLDELDDAINNGAADAAEPALRYTLQRIRTVMESADDSDGSIGDALYRAVDLHARACLEGNPDPVQLAKWLVKYRSSSPGWPETPLELYVQAFDAKALDTYRRGIEKFANHSDTSTFSRSQVLLELADHDSDLDRAVEILQSGDHPQYGEIVSRLRAAGQIRRAMEFTERAIDEDRIRVDGGNTYWLDAEEVVSWLDQDGRQEEALQLLRDLWNRRPEIHNYRALMKYATKLEVGDEEHSRIRTVLEDRAQQADNGREVIETALEDDDLDWAWSAAERWGAGHMRRRLADASASTRPDQAAALYREELDDFLRTANTRSYPLVAEILLRMRAGYASAGAVEDADAYIAQLRETYARRPALLRELDRNGLTG
ncbi:MAG: SWIM zinc finger family protein [Gulosibacter sp.]|uniref:SWIM zinc finger family protein n=1 Tax=Gulosibacter sp. TaxID=2817531 RepID=UPI003F8EBAE1